MSAGPSAPPVRPSTFPRAPRRAGALLALSLAFVACTAEEDSADEPRAGASSRDASSESPSPSPNPSPSATATEPEEPAAAKPRPRALSVPGLAALRMRGSALRLGAVRERTASFTSYDVTYRSRTVGPGGARTLPISGVLNVPRGDGPFPAVVLAHGYIEPSIYVRGQGMTRERGYLADRGYIALHVDYRNHAESGDDPRGELPARLAYSADVVNAVDALQRSGRVPVADDRIALMGRSMGGGVVLKSLIARPGVVRAGVAWASVSSVEAQNYRQFMADDPGRSGIRTPASEPRLWRGLSARPYLDRITEPVLLVHGRYDDTCPPPWATATQRALTRAGVDSRLRWYDDGHAFGPAFNAAMDRVVRFFDRRMGS